MKQYATATQPPQRPLALLQRLGKETLRRRKGNKGVYFIKVLNCNTGNLTVQKVILQ